MDEKKIVGMAINKEYAKSIYQETDPGRIPEKPEALDNLTVLDLSYGSFAGLYASSLLSELGAEVIRVEPPGGDIARKMTPYGKMIKDSGLPYIVEARNKYHVTLDLNQEEGQEILKGLVKHADVLIETFKPGYTDSLGLGYHQMKGINPRLIYCSIHTFGQFGSEAERHFNQPDYDLNDQARGVVMSVTGEPDLDPQVPKEYKRPLRQGNWMGWYVAGGWAAFGINMAVFNRYRSGEGQFIDCSPPEGLFAIANYLFQYYHMSGNKMVRAGNYDYAVFPYSYFKCKDGYAFISGFTDPNWAAICDLMERPDLQERFPTIKERLTPENQPIIQHEIEKWTQNYTSEELLDLITEYSKRPDKKGTVVTGRLEEPRDTLQREHWNMRETFVEFDDPHYGKVLIQNSSLHGMSRTPGRIKWVCRPVGADNTLIYKQFLGYGPSRLKELTSRGVI